MQENNIKDLTIFLMIFVAICFDAGQAVAGWIPIVGNIFADIVSFFAFVTFYLWFWWNGIKMMTLKRFSSMIGAGLIEMIPYINLLPAWTLLVFYTIGTTKVERLAQKHPSLAAGAMAVGGKIKSIQKQNPLQQKSSGN